MIIEVELKQSKKYWNSIKNYNAQFTFENCICKIQIANSCLISIDGDSKGHIIDIYSLIWEILCLYEGYFFKVLSYRIDGWPTETTELYHLNYYVTGAIWYDSASSLIGDGFELTTDMVKAYYSFRDKSFENEKMLRSLMNSYFYLRSENYDHINASHRLSILLNMCDGFMINEIGDKNSLKEKYSSFISSYITKEKFEYGLQLFGFDSNEIDIYEYLANERHIIDHYKYKKFSLSAFAKNHNIDDGILIGYLVYIIELALRAGFISKFGRISKHMLNDCVDNINDWAIQVLNLDTPCVLPYNRMKQMFQKGSRNEL